MDTLAPTLKEITKGLTKKTETQPGWLYLLILIQLLIAYFGVPKRLRIGPWMTGLPTLSPEIWVAVATYTAYQVGDVLDKVTFMKRGPNGEWDVQRYQPEKLKEVKARARWRLGIREGSYGVSLKILEAAKKGRFNVHFINESAKFFRSLLVPGFLASLIVASDLPLVPGLLLATASSALTYFLAYYVYPRLKTRHITNLYNAIPAIISEDEGRVPKPNLFVQDTGEIRLFLWDGSQVTMARRPVEDAQPT